MKEKNKKFSDNQIQEIIMTIFLAFVMLFIFVKILFF
jgi:hypothetical protein